MEKTITKIQKRNGHIADFNANKITKAIFKSMEAAGCCNIDLANELCSKVVATLQKNLNEEMPKVEYIQDIVEQTLVEAGQAKTAKAYILYRQKRSEIRKQKQQLLQKKEIDEIDKKFDLNGLRVLCSRYLKKDKDGNIVETVKELFERVAVHTTLPSLFFDERVFQKQGTCQTQEKAKAQKELAGKLKIGRFVLNEFHINALERIYNRLNEKGQMKVSFDKITQLLQTNGFDTFEKEADDYFELMTERKFFPNTPAIVNFGNYLGMGSACFVIPVEDSIESIMEALTKSAMVFKSGGGVGYNFSALRPEGDFIKTTGGKSSGPLSFMSLFDKMTDVIKQGGIRRGASMGILNSNHPDIEQFITAKKGNQALKNFNISVFIKSDFWDYYQNKKPYPLRNPKDGKIIKYINPVNFFDLIVYQAWESAEPGVIFDEHVNENNPFLKTLGPIQTTNPCLGKNVWVTTQNGPRQIKELIGTKTNIVLNDKIWQDNGIGFFKTGKKLVYNLTTKEGFSIQATSTHPFKKITSQTRYRINTAWEKLEGLKKGDKILLNVNKKTEWPGEYTDKEGYLMGFLVGDGCIASDKTFLNSWGESNGEKNARKKVSHYIQSFPHRADFKGWWYSSKTKKYTIASAWLKNLAIDLKIKSNKQITPEVEKCSSQFYKGFLRGFFDTDGSVQGNSEKGLSIRLAQSNIARLEAAQRMLLRLGIFSRIYRNRRKAGLRPLPDGKGGYKNYKTKAQHELVISCENILLFKKKIGFYNTDKLAKLNDLLKVYRKSMQKEHFMTEIKSIEKSTTENVYNISIPGVNSFDANGFYVKNCGELPLYPLESCNLGSINLWAFCDSKPTNGRQKNVEFDWKGLKEVIKLTTKFLDNVIEVNKLPLPEIEKATLGTRKIGLGLMGLADVLYELEIPYDSPEGLGFMEKTMEYLNFYSKETSVELAKERGVFDFYDKSFYKEGRLPFSGNKTAGALPLKEASLLDWDGLLAKIQEHGIRNSQTTTNAPTGSISMIAGCSSGIEPNFSLVFEKKITIGSFYYVNPVFEKVMEREGLFDEALIKAVSHNKGSIKNISYMPPKLKQVFVTAMDLSAQSHIKALAALQKWTDSSISKTINFPSTATLNDMKEAFLLAHELGCKDITAFRDQSIQGVLSAGATSEKPKENKTQELVSLKDEKAKGPVIFQSTAVDNGDPAKNNDLCANCSSFLIATEGCKKCPKCGWAVCSSG